MKYSTDHGFVLYFFVAFLCIDLKIMQKIANVLKVVFDNQEGHCL